MDDFIEYDIQDQYMETLVNELADKKHVIANLKSQLQHLLQEAQLHEHDYNMIELEKNNLEKKLSRAQSDYTLLIYIKDGLENSIQMLEDSKICLEEKIEFLKKENDSLHNEIDVLNKEKYKLLQNLSKSEDDEKLFKTDNHIESLKSQVSDLFEEISRQEVINNNLTIENVESKMKNEFNSPLQNSISSIVTEKNTLISSTPRNNVSLMQEAMQVNNDLMEDLEVKVKENTLLKNNIENLNKLICNMKNCLHVSKNIIVKYEKIAEVNTYTNETVEGEAQSDRFRILCKIVFLFICLLFLYNAVFDPSFLKKVCRIGSSQTYYVPS